MFTSLKERSQRGSEIETIKILKGFTKITKELWFQIRGTKVGATRRTTGLMEGPTACSARNATWK